MATTDATRYVAEVDARHRTFIQENFHHQVADPHLYDLVINVELLSIDQTAELIVQTINGWIAKSGITNEIAPT